MCYLLSRQVLISIQHGFKVCALASSVCKLFWKHPPGGIIWGYNTDSWRLQIDHTSASLDRAWQSACWTRVLSDCCLHTRVRICDLDNTGTDSKVLGGSSSRLAGMPKALQQLAQSFFLSFYLRKWVLSSLSSFGPLQIRSLEALHEQFPLGFFAFYF